MNRIALLIFALTSTVCVAQEVSHATTAYRELHSSCTANGPGIWAIGDIIHCGCGRYCERDPDEERRVMWEESNKEIKRLAAKKGVWHCVKIEPSRSPITASIEVNQ